LGIPGNTNGLHAMLKSPVYSTGVGLVTYKTESETNKVTATEVFTDMFGVMKDWLKGPLDRLSKLKKYRKKEEYYV
jgi:cell division ATPase FtsA